MKKNRASKNKTKNTSPPQKDALNIPKHTFLMPSQSSVAQIVKYINHVTQIFAVTRIVKGVSTKKRGIVLKYEKGKIHIHLNHGFGLHLGRDICQVLGIKNEKIIPNKLGHIVMREGQQYETVPIINEQINKSPEQSTVFVCTDLIKNQYFESKTLPLLKAVICGSE